MTDLTTRVRGFGSALILLTLILGAPLLLIYMRSMPDFGVFSWDRLNARDDGTLALAVIYLGCWICWAIFAGSVLVAVVSALQGVRTPRLPGLMLPQAAANHLVASVALLFVAVPIAQAAVIPHADAIVPPEPASRAVHTEPEPDVETVPTGDAPAAGTTDQAQTVTYTVRRGDSLWRIAEKHLGAGTRYPEIAALNTHVLASNPDYLEPGLILRLPAPAKPDGGAETYLVQPGDTLSEIAADRTGDPDRYPQIFDASTGVRQPDGSRLTDPDMIQPGWTLIVPDPTTPEVRGGVSPAQPEIPPTAKPPAATSPSSVPSPQASPTPDVHAPAPASPGPDRATDQEGPSTWTSVPGWVLPGLTGSGALLAGALFLAVRNHRRSRMRDRRPGHMIAPPPPELDSVAKTVHLTGTVTTPDVLGIDHLLSRLREQSGPLPRIETVEVEASKVTLHLATDAELPAPWTGAGATWTAPLDRGIEHSAYACPYPLLVSVGADRAGHQWLVNLEKHPYVTITGDQDRSSALARYITAELAFNPWSVVVQVDSFGVAAELTFADQALAADGWRHTHHQDEDGFLVRLLEGLDLDGDDTREPDEFHAVVATTEHAEAVRRFTDAVAASSRRHGTAVVLVSDDPEPTSTVIHVSADGILRVPALGLKLRAAGLSPQEADACAAIYAATEHLENVTIPAPTGDVGETANGLDSSGALRREHTEPRPDVDPSGDRSLLPLITEAYVAQAATTREDLEQLAPITPSSVRDAVTEGDPTLDNDVDLFFDPDCPLPRVTLLGPVSANAHGDPAAVARRRPFYAELLSYLVLRPGGVPGAQIAEDFGLRIERVRTDIGNVRKWLGTNPITGQPHLPTASAGDATGARGAAKYGVEGVLTDWELFKRLRARGQSRGAEGIDDLVTALDLVTGEPFSHLRPAGWSWLNDLRTNDIAQCAIVDTAHIVTAHALEKNDTNLALVTVEIACKASPYDEICRLDLARVKEACGDVEAARSLLDRDVFNRSDDHLGPLEPSLRTIRVAAGRGWLTDPNRRSRPPAEAD